MRNSIPFCIYDNGHQFRQSIIPDHDIHNKFNCLNYANIQSPFSLLIYCKQSPFEFTDRAGFYLMEGM